MQILENYSLKKLNTFEIEAKARFFVEVGSEDEALQAVEFAKQKGLEVFVLGGGSNILISDNGFEGLVIRNALKKLEIKDSRLEIGAGENWDDVVAAAVD